MTDRRGTVEDTALARLGFVKRKPLAHECAQVRLLGVDRGVVGIGAKLVLIPPRAAFSVAHALVGEIRQTKHGRPADAAALHDIADHAERVVAVERGQFATGTALKHIDRKLEETIQGLGSRCASAEGLQHGTLGAQLGQVPFRNQPTVEQTNELTRAGRPSNAAVHHVNRRVGRIERLGNSRELRHQCLLYRKAHTGSAHRQVHRLVKDALVVNCSKGTVVPRGFVALQCFAGGRQRAHGWQHLQVLDSVF